MPWVCGRRLSPSSGFWMPKYFAKSWGTLTIELDTSVPKRNLPWIFQIFLPPPEINVNFAYKHRWTMNQFSCKMKVKICPCFLSACSLWQMKWDEGTAVQWVPGVQFKVAIQVLPFVMFQLYHLVGQNGTHYFGYSASQSVSWGPSGCAALGQADPSCSRAYFVSHSGPRVCAPLLPTAAWWLVMILVLEEQIYQKKDYLPSCLLVALQGPGEPCCYVPKEKTLFSAEVKVLFQFSLM